MDTHQLQQQKPISWRVLINPKLWDQEKYEKCWEELPEHRRIAQSKGFRRMKLLPQRGDNVSFVMKGKIRMRGIVECDGFMEGTAHQEHSCNIGTMNERIHSLDKHYTWIKITEIKLTEPIRRTGQSTWAKFNR